MSALISDRPWVNREISEGLSHFWNNYVKIVEITLISMTESKPWINDLYIALYL